MDINTKTMQLFKSLPVNAKPVMGPDISGDSLGYSKLGGCH